MPELFPGYDPASPRSFSRNQGYDGTCRAFASTDYICYELKRLGKLSGRSDFNQGCSAEDLDIQAFAGYNSETDQNTITRLFGLSENGKYIGNTAKLNPDQYIKLAKEKGMCPESAMPSELGANHLDLRKVYLALQQHLKERKASTRKDIPLEDWCPECRSIAPNLSESQWDEITRLLARTDLETQNFRILGTIDEMACPDSKRVKLPEDYSIDSRSYDGMEDHLATAGGIALLSIHATPLLPPGHVFDDGGDSHAVVVYGTTTFQDSRKCFFALKNSWGPDACVSKSPDLRCEPDGTFLVSSQLLKQITMDIQW